MNRSLPIKHRLSARLCAAALVFTVSCPGTPALAQSRATSASPSVLPTGGGRALLDVSDTLILLLDHQAGLLQTVKDNDAAVLRANAIALARLGTILKIPVITTASEPKGPNGPIFPEIEQAAPHAVYVPRRGEVNSWDNPDFVAAVRATGRKTLIIAGIWTSVCVMFPALDAKVAGYKVYAVVDASGDPSQLASQASLARFVQGGVIPTSTNVVIAETFRTWNRPEAPELAKLNAMIAPNYQAVIESFEKAQEVAREPK